MADLRVGKIVDDFPFDLGTEGDAPGFTALLDEYMSEVAQANSLATFFDPAVQLGDLTGDKGQSSAMPETLPWNAGAGAAAPPVPSRNSSPGVEPGRSDSFGSADNIPPQAACQGHPATAAQGKAALKAQKLAEKNRRAQKKFREKQKARMKDSSNAIEELSAKLKEATLLNNHLQSRNKLLETMMSVKEEHIARLEATAGESLATDPPPNEEGSPPAPETEPKSTSYPPGVDPALQDALYRFLVVLRKDSALPAGPHPSEGGTVITYTTIKEKHKEYIESLARCFMNGADDPSTPAYARLLELIQAMHTITTQMGMMNDLLYMKAHAHQPGSPHQQGGPLPGDSHWKEVLTSGGLSMTQRKTCIKAHRALLVRMRNLLVERRELVKLLQGETSSRAHTDITEQYTQMRQATERMRNNLKSEYASVFEFLATITESVLQPLQEARMEVTAYPNNLDYIRCCSIMAEELSAAGELEPDATPGSIQEEILTQMPEHSPFRLLAERATRAQSWPGLVF